MVRSTQQVFEHHRDAILALDLAEGLADYADDSVLVTLDRVLVGKEGTEAFYDRSSNESLFKIRVAYFPIVGLRQVDRSKGIVSGYPVLDCQYCGRCLRVLEEEGVMSDAEAQKDIEIGILVVQQFGLIDRIAHGFIRALPDLFLIPQADALLGSPSGFADHRNHLEPTAS